MPSIPKKVLERLVSGLKRYHPILAAAKARDVGETDFFETGYRPFEGEEVGKAAVRRLLW